jgi:hypothetical protein
LKGGSVPWFIPFLCFIALAWHLLIGGWAIITVSRLRESAPDTDRHMRNLENLQRLVSGIQQELHALAAIQENKGALASEPRGLNGQAPCTCGGDADRDRPRRGRLGQLPQT